MTSNSRKAKKENSSLILPNVPAIVFEEKEFGKTLLIADLHIGYLYGKNRRGIIVPRTELPEEDLYKLVKETEAKRVIILGDFKDEIFGGNHPLAGRIWTFVKRVLGLTHLTIVKGNHDGKIEELLPEEVELIAPTGLRLEEKNHHFSLGLWHGHATPGLDIWDADITITGHAHPAYSFMDEIGSKITEKVWVKANWLNIEEQKRKTHIIMPAFNRYIDGYSVDGELFKTTFLIKDAVDFLNAEVFTLEGVLIGTIGELQEARAEIVENLKQHKRNEKNMRRKKR